MKNSSARNLVISFSLLVLIAIAPIFKDKIFGESQRISITDNPNEMTIIATFPEQSSKIIQDYIRKELALNDLPDLNYLEIKNYQTTDKLMIFYIKSQKGYVKISMDKARNSEYGYKKLKAVGDGLKRLVD